MTRGSADAFHELQLRLTLPELGRAVAAEATRAPCVILASGAFAALRERPGAVHVRLWAPLEWRVDRYRERGLVDRHAAEAAVHHHDHLQHTWVRTLFHLDVDDPRHFSLVLEESRFPNERLVEILLADGGGAS